MLQHPQCFNASTSSKPQHPQSLDISTLQPHQNFNAIEFSKPLMSQCLNVLNTSTRFNSVLSMIKAKRSTLFVVINDKVCRTAEPIATRLFVHSSTTCLLLSGVARAQSSMLHHGCVLFNYFNPGDNWVLTSMESSFCSRLPGDLRCKAG